MFATVGNENLRRRNLESGVPLGLKGDGLAQSWQTGRWGVLVVSWIRAGFNGRFDNVGRRWEVRFAGSVANDGLAGGLEGLGFGIDSQGRRRRQSG